MLAVLAIVIPAVVLLGDLGAHVFSEVRRPLNETSLIAAAGSPPPPSAASPTLGRGEWFRQARWIGIGSAAIAAIAVSGLVLRKKYVRKIAAPRPLATHVETRSSLSGSGRRQQILRWLANHPESLFQGDLSVRHVMMTCSATLRPNDTVRRALDMMEQHRVDYLLVTDADEKLLGLVSHHYLQETSARRVSDAMLAKPFFVSSEAMLSPTVTHMLNEGVSCVAVVQDDRAIGMVTTIDIQLTFQAVLQTLARASVDGQIPQPDPVATV
ncbi:MAG: CBS domain-containing protein [Planctomycetota bacterium]|nr:MAG: CBS domain-containing protein [Planctomycetota bacterium]